MMFFTCRHLLNASWQSEVQLNWIPSSVNCAHVLSTNSRSDIELQSTAAFAHRSFIVFCISVSRCPSQSSMFPLAATSRERRMTSSDPFSDDLTSRMIVTSFGSCTTLSIASKTFS